MDNKTKEINLIIKKISNLDVGTRFKCLASDVFKSYILYGKTGMVNKNFIRFIFFSFFLFLI